jgi:aryl-alcohol dehydrogenase-like predicted oxidoreductase
MKYLVLGASGLRVSRISLGTMTWFNRMSYDRFIAAAEFHDERAELL